MINVGDYFKIENMENCSSLSSRVTKGRLYLCTKTASSAFPCSEEDPYVYFTDDYGITAYHYANMFNKVDSDVLHSIAPMFRDDKYAVHDMYDQYPAPTSPKKVLYDVCDVYTESTGEVTSDGGSSSYYGLEVAGHKIETHDIITDVFDNDFDMGNMFKAQVRIQAAINGSGKAGTSIEYDLNKIIYTCNKLKDKHVKTS